MNIITNRRIRYENFSNGDGGGKKALAGLGLAAATAGIGAIANRAGNPKTGLASDVKAACGRKPLFGKAKKEAYAKCANQFANKSVSANMPGKQGGAKPPMSMGVKIAIGLGIAAILGITAYVIIKRRKKGK